MHVSDAGRKMLDRSTVFASRQTAVVASLPRWI